MTHSAERAAGAPVRRQPRVDALGSGLIVLGSLQFGAVVVLGKIVTDGGLPVPAYLAVRFAVAALLLCAALAATRQPLAAARGERWRLVVLGMAGYGVEAGLFFAALRHSSAAMTALLFFTYPVLVTLLTAAIGRGLPSGLVVLSLSSAVAGAALVVLAGQGLVVSGAGVLLALGAALVFSVYLLGVDVVLDRTNSLTGSMWVSASAAVPLAASVLAVIFLGESLGPATVIGGTLILAGAVTASLARRGRPGEPPAP